jgi:Cu2+-exporting ATPase
MLIELGFFICTYGCLNFLEKKKKQQTVKNKLVLSTEKKALEEKSNKLLTEDNTTPSNSKTYKKDLIIASINLGNSVLQPIFFPSLSLMNAVLLSYSSYPYLKGAKNSLKNKKIGNDVLGASWAIFAVASGQYFAAALGNIIYHLGTNFIEKTRNQSCQSLVHIFDQQDRQAWLLSNGIEIEVPLSTILVNDIVLVNSGEMIPVDGKIVKGQARIDEHILTGESQVVEKICGEEVFASTLIISGSIQVKVTKAGNDTAVAKIEKVLNKSIDFKSTLQLKGEAWADKTAPYLLSIAGLTAITIGFTPAAAILAANFGYQIRMVSPLSTLRHLKKASNVGILIKDGRSLERLNDVDTIVFDKTGTLTEEQPKVGKIISWGSHGIEEILRMAATAEVKLKHPIAKAIQRAYDSYNNPLDNIDDSFYEIGFGTKIKLNKQIIRVGSLRFMQNEGLSWSEKKQATLEPIYQQGHSVVFVGIEDEIAGAIEIKPTIRPEIPELIQQLKQRGIKHLMIVSGDHDKPTQQLAENLGIPEYFAEILPKDKAKIVSDLQQQGRKVCFIGDGINDTIAMKQADVSISLQGASTIATDTADILLMKGDLTHLHTLFNIADSTNKVMQKSTIMVILPAGLILIGGIGFHMGLLGALLIKQSFLGANILYVTKQSR